MIGQRFGAAGAVTALLAQGFAVACCHGSRVNGPHHPPECARLFPGRVGRCLYAHVAPSFSYIFGQAVYMHAP